MAYQRPITLIDLRHDQTAERRRERQLNPAGAQDDQGGFNNREKHRRYKALRTHMQQRLYGAGHLAAVCDTSARNANGKSDENSYASRLAAAPRAGTSAG